MLGAHLRGRKALSIQLDFRFPVFGVRKRLFEGMQRQGMVIEMLREKLRWR